MANAFSACIRSLYVHAAVFKKNVKPSHVAVLTPYFVSFHKDNKKYVIHTAYDNLK